MYGFLTSLLVLTTMICFITPQGNRFNTARSSDYDDYDPTFQENHNFQVQQRSVGRAQQRQNNGPYSQDNRHTQTPIKVDKTRPENIQVASTPRPYVKPAQNTKFYFNTTKVDNKRNASEYGGQAMVFPGDEGPALKPSIISRNCSFGLCDDVDNYPSDKIQRILNRSPLLKSFLFTEVIPDVESRFKEPVEGMCSTMSHTRFPKSAVNVKSVEQILVNVDNYKQGVVFETCTQNEGPCNYSENFPNNHVPTCMQKFTVRKLMVVGKESDNPIFDDFMIPSCCVCTIQKQKR